MRHFMIIAVGAALLAGAPLAASAQSASQIVGTGNQRGNYEPDRRPGMDRPGNGPTWNGDNYGRWDNGWGRRPPPPPKHFGKQGRWYQHVRACSARYRSYNPRTDTYQVRRGVNRVCRL
jgi:hypothetical protein